MLFIAVNVGDRPASFDINEIDFDSLHASDTARPVRVKATEITE